MQQDQTQVGQKDVRVEVGVWWTGESSIPKRRLKNLGTVREFYTKGVKIRAKQNTACREGIWPKTKSNDMGAFWPTPLALHSIPTVLHARKACEE